VGDGEAETGPLATSWHSNKFLSPLSDGVVLPILHLNGYKIANPTVLARISHEELDHLFRGYGYTPHFVEGHEPEQMHELMAATLDTVFGEIQRIKADARRNGFTSRPRWPMIVLRTPKGWTCPKEIDGKRTEGHWRAHQVPMGEMHENPEHVRILEQWMKSYRPAELFDEGGRLARIIESTAGSRKEVLHRPRRGDGTRDRVDIGSRRNADHQYARSKVCRSQEAHVAVRGRRLGCWPIFRTESCGYR
jgi:xylulose-5-phosphate/fructose-6-phosphate phosphoketolase